MPRFAAFLAEQPDCPRDLDGVTADMLRRWRLAKLASPGGRQQVRTVGKLLRGNGRSQSRPVAELLARRVPGSWGSVQSYDTASFDHIVRTARQDFRAALLRIEDNGRLQHTAFSVASFPPASWLAKSRPGSSAIGSSTSTAVRL